MLELHELTRRFGPRTAVIPTRWAVDGLDATTWRGLGLSAVAWPIVWLSAAALVFGGLAVAHFRWEDD